MKHTVDTLEVESGWMALKGHDPNRRMVKATLVIGDERVFTESEVRAMLKAVRDELEANCRWQSGVEVVSASAMRQAFHRPDVLSRNPA